MFRSFLALAATLIPAAAFAQVTPPAQTVAPAAAPTPLASPTPATTPSAVATPSPAATSAPAEDTQRDDAPAPPPEPTATPRPTPLPTPAPAAEPAIASPSPEPVATPTPMPMPTATSTPVQIESPSIALPGAITTDAGDAAEGGGGWLLLGGIALIVVAALIVAGVVLPRRRRAGEGKARAEAPAIPVPPPPPPPPSATPRFLDPVPAAKPAAASPLLGYRPSRLGLNLVSVTATGEVLVTNDGPGSLADVRVRATLLAAAAGHETAVAAVHRDPVARLAAPPFPLGPGETRGIRLVVAATRSGIDPLTVAGRPMMVPLVAVTLDWRDAAGEHRRTQAFAVGVERVDSPKLAPVWLDQDSRSFDAVAARPHGDPIG